MADHPSTVMERQLRALGLPVCDVVKIIDRDVFTVWLTGNLDDIDRASISTSDEYRQQIEGRYTVERIVTGSNCRATWRADKPVIMTHLVVYGQLTEKEASV